jgi:LmbE family N-acetylglucosaminyl deacetylase
MKPTARPAPDPAPLLAFGAHPDDIEFGCGAIVALETRAGRPAHLVVCSRGESGSRGTPAVRRREAQRGAALLGASLEFIELDGDGQLEVRPAHALALARIIRRQRPALVLAPSLSPNQHPDHPRLGQLVRDAVRLARYGGLARLKPLAPHAVEALFFYALTRESEPPGELPVLIDVSDPEVVLAWTASMNAHASQVAGRDYPGLQLARSRVHGHQAGVAHAQALYPGDPIVFGSLGDVARSARRF